MNFITPGNLQASPTASPATSSNKNTSLLASPVPTGQTRQAQQHAGAAWELQNEALCSYVEKLLRIVMQVESETAAYEKMKRTKTSAIDKTPLVLKEFERANLIQELDTFVRKHVRGSGYRPEEVIFAPEPIDDIIGAEASVNLKVQYLLRQVLCLEKAVVRNLFEAPSAQSVSGVENFKLAGA